MLEKQRNKIDQLDREIVKLFETRTKVVEEVAQVKLANDMDILDASREDIVIEKVQAYLEDPALNNEVADLYKEIMRISRQHQKEWIDKQVQG